LLFYLSAVFSHDDDAWKRIGIGTI
jgi:hypothetical protein